MTTGERRLSWIRNLVINRILTRSLPHITRTANKQRLAILIYHRVLAQRDALREKFPTAALAELVFDVPAWTAIAPKTGTLARFETPRSVRSASTR